MERNSQPIILTLRRHLTFPFSSRALPLMAASALSISSWIMIYRSFQSRALIARATNAAAPTLRLCLRT